MRTVTTSKLRVTVMLTGRERPANVIGDGFGSWSCHASQGKDEGSNPSQNAVSSETECLHSSVDRAAAFYSACRGFESLWGRRWNDQCYTISSGD